MNVQHKDFADRIARIESGENSFKSTIFVGNGETYRPEDLRRAVRKAPVRAKVAAKPKSGQVPKKRGVSLLSLPLAFLVGVVAMVLWRLVDFHMHGVPTGLADPTQMFAINMATGMALAILICQALALTAPQHVLAALIGLVAMTFGFQTAVNIAPDQFAQMFSPAWVGQLLAMNGPVVPVQG